MTVWKVASLALQASIVLESWAIVLVDGHDWHFVGYASCNCEGRVSSKIEHFDLEARTGRTASGRIYRLEGPPGSDPDARYVFERWCAISRVKQFEEITEQVLAGSLAPPDDRQ